MALGSLHVTSRDFRMPRMNSIRSALGTLLPTSRSPTPMNGVTTMSMKLTVPRKNLVAATASSAILAALACLSTASAQTGPGQSTTVQNPRAEMARCSQLFSTRSRYHANGSNYSAQDTQAELALEQCKAGHYDAGIASLEGILRQNGIAVPPSETATAPR